MPYASAGPGFGRKARFVAPKEPGILLGSIPTGLLHCHLGQSSTIPDFLDMGLCAHLAGWQDPETLRLGSLRGAAFETHVFGDAPSAAGCRDLLLADPGQVVSLGAQDVPEPLTDEWRIVSPAGITLA